MDDWLDPLVTSISVKSFVGVLTGNICMMRTANAITFHWQSKCDYDKKRKNASRFSLIFGVSLRTFNPILIRVTLIL